MTPHNTHTKNCEVCFRFKGTKRKTHRYIHYTASTSYPIRRTSTKHNYSAKSQTMFAFRQNYKRTKEGNTTITRFRSIELSRSANGYVTIRAPVHRISELRNQERDEAAGPASHKAAARRGQDWHVGARVLSATQKRQEVTSKTKCRCRASDRCNMHTREVCIRSVSVVCQVLT